MGGADDKKAACVKRPVYWLAGGMILLGVLLLAGGLVLPPPASVTLQWATASEVDTVGFLIYRSDSLTGAYRRITPQLIPAANDPLAGARYHYEDTATVPGQTYYYALEDVAADGTTTRHGPIVIQARAVRQELVLAGLLLVVGGVMLGWLVRAS